jgi:uncharacterized protein
MKSDSGISLANRRLLGWACILFIGIAAGVTVFEDHQKTRVQHERQQSEEQEKNRVGAIKAKLERDSQEYQRVCETDGNDNARWEVARRRLAEAGNSLAQYSLAEELFYMKRDYASAIPWFEKAAKQGDTSAMTRLAFVYSYSDHGKNAFVDDKAAMKWYKRAAELGDADAMGSLGDIFWYGTRVPQNYVEALTWYTKAAEAGNDGSVLRLGSMYKDGKGVRPDSVEAYKWLSIGCVVYARLAPVAVNEFCEMRDGVAKQVNSADLVRAQGLASKWMKEFRK